MLPMGCPWVAEGLKERGQGASRGGRGDVGGMGRKSILTEAERRGQEGTDRREGG